MSNREVPHIEELDQHVRMSDWYAVRAGLPRRFGKPIKESRTSWFGFCLGFCLGALITLLILGG